MSANLDSVRPEQEASFAAKASWVMYDWANSGYGLVVITAVFPSFFISGSCLFYQGAPITEWSFGARSFPVTPSSAS